MIDERLPVHYLGANELLLEVAVDGAGGFLRGAVHRNGPGAYFGFPRREKRHQTEQRVGRRNEPIER